MSSFLDTKGLEDDSPDELGSLSQFQDTSIHPERLRRMPYVPLDNNSAFTEPRRQPEVVVPAMSPATKAFRDKIGEVRESVEIVKKSCEEDWALSAFSSLYMMTAIDCFMGTSSLNFLAINADPYPSLAHSLLVPLCGFHPPRLSFFALI